MVLFQPGADPTVWDFSWYGGIGNLFDIVFWIVAIISIVFALFLLASYLNERKPAHFYWGISFAILYINTHVVIFSGTFATFLDQVPAVLSALMIGLFAVGLFKNVKPEKDKMGDYLLYYVLIMSLVIGFFKGAYLGLPAIVAPILVMALHIPSAILIIWLPLKTRSENGKSVFALTTAAVLMSLVGILLVIAVPLAADLAVMAAAYADAVDAEILTPAELLVLKGILDVFQAQVDAFLEPIFYAFPFVYLGAGLCFAWGIFVPKRWNFAIAGIELED